MGSVHEFKPRPRKQSQFEGPTPQGNWTPARQTVRQRLWQKHRRALLVGGAWTLILTGITLLAVFNP
jgi:hypothetical protein